MRLCVLRQVRSEVAPARPFGGKDKIVPDGLMSKPFPIAKSNRLEKKTAVEDSKRCGKESSTTMSTLEHMAHLKDVDLKISPIKQPFSGFSPTDY